MNKKFFALIAFFFLLGALLVYQAKRVGTSVVMTPSELLAEQPSSSTRVRVVGKVTADEHQYQTDPAIELRFMIHDIEEPNQKIKVLYRDIKPDMFAPGLDVIINGYYQGQVLVASNLQTQCPSKYEPPSAERYLDEEESA